jgi:hypothetical protein
MDFIIRKLREPSTWAGVAVLGTLFGVPPGTIELTGQVVGGLAGLAAIVMNERANGQ